MHIGILLTPQTIVLGVIASAAVSGIGPLIYDIHEAREGHHPVSRYAKIAADIFACMAFTMTIIAHHAGDYAFRTNAIVLYSAAIATRVALTLFCKWRGEHSNLW